MPNQDRERVRKILEAALEKLDRNSYEGGERTVLMSDSGDSTSPVIVLLGGLNPGALDAVEARPPHSDGFAQATEPNSGAAAHDNAHASHPGLERFPLAETQSNAAAPQTCFIEPGRNCVGSGACEMRGY